jgi:hypothetical protein
MKLKQEVDFKDSLINEKYKALQGFALCKCVYNVPENTENKKYDISPSIYADIVNFWGIDTLEVLAEAHAKSIKLSTYQDYKGKRPTFISCTEWVNSKNIDSLIKKYAIASANEWIRRENEYEK